MKYYEYIYSMLKSRNECYDFDLVISKALLTVPLRLDH